MFNLQPEILLLQSFILSFVITYLSIPSIIKVADSKNLFDEPVERSAHTYNIPTLGGLAIFAGFSVSVLIFSDNSSFSELKYIISAVIILFFVGLKDDILIIAPLTKLGGQIFASLVIIIFTDLRFTDFHGFFGITDISDYVSYPFTLLVYLVLINGFNLIDGIDGLSSGAGLVAAVSFGIWFYLSGYTDFAFISAGLSGALIAFLRFNVFSQKNKIFMGDTGSLILGLIISVLTVKFNELNINTKADYSKYAAPAISFAVLILPLFDTIRIMFIRFFQRKPLFSPDKQHIHHLFIKIGFSHKKALATLIFINTVFAASAFLFHNQLGIRRMILVYILVAMIIFYIPAFILNHRKKNAKSDK